MQTTTATTFAAVAALSLAIAVPAFAQSTGPKHAGYDPNATIGGHYHEGELGDKLMVLETALKCNCGCGLDVHSCQFTMQCAESPAWSKRIRDELAADRSVDVIQAGFVADFGTTVLMMPPPQGFNLLGYFLPAMAIVSAGLLVGILAKGGQTREALAPVATLSDDEAERLRAAMQKLDESESPDW